MLLTAPPLRGGEGAGMAAGRARAITGGRVGDA